uniref:ribonucleoside-diphosphate reductase n=1 Tax=viral metagenome TaxID=1070528 RepID=A0A6C0AS89_9ZZZZ
MTSPAKSAAFPEIMTSNDEMYVTKRNGASEIVSFDKILNRIKKLGQDIKINYTNLVMKVIDQLYDGISTTKIDELSAEQCASMASIHPDYNVLAGRITISNHHRETSDNFVDVMTQLYQYKDKHGKQSPLVSDALFECVVKYGVELEAMINYDNDFLIDYFGFKTLERAYLMKIDKKTVERPQHMWLRVAIGIHYEETNVHYDNNAILDKIQETYQLMSQKYFTHATPTLFNSGTPHQQNSSCYLIALEEDSIEGIYNTLKDCAMISKWAGGIGLHIHNIRASGSHIRGTNGQSNGIVPMLRVFNNTAKYVDQCINPETIIYTTHGPKQIQHCIAGETEICNLNGDIEVIENVLEHSYDGDILEIEIMHSITPLQITLEHPVYALTGQKKGLNYKVIKNRLDKKICDFEWVDAKDLTTDDMLVFPIPKHSKDISNISEDDCYLYGVIMGDGSMSNDTETTGYVSLHTTNKRHILDFMIKYFDDRYVNYRIDTDNNTTRIRWNRCIHLPFRYNDFYDENKEKRVQPRWLNLPIEKSKFILKGLLDTDGCNKGELVFDSTSYNLIESVRFLTMRMGVLTSGYIRDRVGESHMTSRGIIENKRVSYCLRIPKTEDICELMKIEFDNKQFFKFMRHNDLLLTRIQSIKESKYKGILYDLQMKKQHDYLIHNGLVHNGGGKRNGSFAIYLEPWHADIEFFLQMRKNHGDEELKARDLFYALWTPDLFMERVKADGQWTLMCPDECPGLADVYGDEFKKLYLEYEQSGKGRKTMKARDLWFQVLDAQMETGTPYLLYKDACNKKSNQKNLGTIKSSNLCVAPETMILTEQGHKEIQTLVNTKVNVWNGKEFSEVDVVQTGQDQELITVETDDGCRIECTPYHKFFIQNSYNKKSIKTVEAKDLKEGDKITKCEYPVIDGKEKMKYAYTHGFFCGDGTYGNVNDEQSPCKFKSLSGHYYCASHLDYETDEMVEQLKNTKNTNNIKPNNRCNAMSYEKKAMIYLYEDKKQLIDHFDYRSKTENNVSIRSPNTKDGVELENSVQSMTTRIVLNLPVDIDEKFFVPMNNTLSDKMEWFSGYCDADGTIAKNGTNLQLQISSVNRTFLMNIKLMLQTCGVNPKLKCMRLAGTSYLPDGKGGHKYFDTQSIYRLLITSVDLQKLVDNGFSTRRLKIDITTPNRAASQFVKIKSVTNTGRIDDTYCFTEPKQHAGIFNGILTSQCSEVVQYSDDKETAVCNLASIGLPTFIVTDPITGKPYLDYAHLHKVVKVVTYNLNRIIDVNFYPTPKTERSNKRHRPIGIGVQGLADVFMLLELPFSSEEAKTINKHIFETIYHAAVEQSCELAERDGPYETFEGSPAQRGQLQFDLWLAFGGKDEGGKTEHNNDRYDWKSLKERVKTHGLRNSLLLAPMPTASTSQILGYNECIEPITSNIYNRRTIAGEFIMANKYLMNDLIKLDLWNERIKNSIIANHGSIQHIDIIPQEIRDRYKTVWEIPMRNLIDMAADRGIYVCQSQSLNLWLEDPTYSNLTSMHFYSWSKGLKTGIYYLRRRARHQAQQFTIEPEKNSTTEGKIYEEAEEEICEMCSA